MNLDTAHPVLSDQGTLADQVTAALRQAIHDGQYPVHSNLPTEAVLTQRYGVSRTVVREAISRLRVDGLVGTRQGSGTVVLGANPNVPFRIDLDMRGSADHAIYVLELRRSVEAEMAALAAQRRSRTEAAAIWRALEAIAQATRQGRDGVKEDIAFHMAIAQASGNPLFPSMLRFLGHLLTDTMHLTRGHEAQYPRKAQKVIAEHTALAQSIQDGDAVAARRAASTHMRNTDMRIRAAMQEQASAAAGRTAGDAPRPATRPTTNRRKQETHP